MRFRLNLSILMVLFCCTFASAQTTQFTGTIRDLTNTPVATGLVNFTLQPGADTTISGVGRFTPNTVNCSIVNQAISTVSRAANVVTVTTSSAHGFTTGDLVNIVGVTDTSYNANGLTITVTGATTFTYAQTAANSSSSGGFAGNIFKFGGTGACTVVSNLSLNPPGTSYKIQLCPLFACTSQFNGYALGGVTDLTTIVPTPGTLPAFHFVDTFANQTVGGNKTFTGANTFSGVNTFSGIPVFPAGIQGTAGQTLALPGSADTLAAATNTLTFTNKIFDTAGAGNIFRIAGALVNSFTGSGSIVAMSVGPAITNAGLTTPTIGGGTPINGSFRVTTGALNFGVIIAQSETDLTFTVTGAATSGVAWCSPTTNLGNGIFTWNSFVSSTNNVTLRVNNTSAGNQTPATVPWNCAVIQ